ncbi:hypothetical protein PGTUg99_027450 [Puccinia graminis f. sp. tritici]|uniref:Uncharacterized protein n=1 Tax=Puccinia graminis f. sp. tritici TaxID=56615 RepID=A0A5B0QVC1_PUCGR|nr:hypothetical protein PGTUg99_027450 [Puccinia graminis f. sp. tritici]
MPVGLPNLASLILLYELQPDLGIYSKPPMTWAGQGQNKSVMGQAHIGPFDFLPHHD